MTHPTFGPWTTEFDSGSRLELSAFWKGRLTRLSELVQEGDVSSRRSMGWLLVMLAPIVLLPSLKAGTRPPEDRQERTVAAGATAFQDGVGATQAIVAASTAPGSDANGEQGAAAETPLQTPPAATVPPADPLAALRDRAIHAALPLLSGSQQDDGTWKRSDKDKKSDTGVTGLCLLTLMRCGVPTDDLRVRRAADVLRQAKANGTYEFALQTLALCAVDDPRDRVLIQRNVQWLERAQFDDGPSRGSWTYAGGEIPSRGPGDNSNTEFALWALDAAARSGRTVHSETWGKALAWWLQCQTPDGGWPYSNRAGSSTGSMTCAGIASVSICLSRLKADGHPLAAEGRQAVERGLQWMGRNFSERTNPGMGSFYLYYTLMLRRAADASATERVGEHAWLRETATFLLKQQHQSSGQWVGVGDLEQTTIGTCLALLTLVGVDPSPIPNITPVAKPE